MLPWAPFLGPQPPAGGQEAFRDYAGLPPMHDMVPEYKAYLGGLPFAEQLFIDIRSQCALV